MEFKGYIQVYTGNGKGKTTAALGLALRAAGRGMKTYIAQFMKKQDYGELHSIGDYLGDHIVIEQFGLPDFHYTGKDVTTEEKMAALEGVEAVLEAISSKEYHIIVMDEVNVLLYFEIIDPEHVLTIIDNKPNDVELILTGRNAPQEILDRADLITEMKEVKHYYQEKVQAREGIEK